MQMDGHLHRELVSWMLLTHRSGTQLQWLGVTYGELLVEQERQDEPWLQRGSRCQAGRPDPKPCISIMSPVSEGKKRAMVRAWQAPTHRHPAACPPLCPELQQEVTRWWRTTVVVPAWSRAQRWQWWRERECLTLPSLVIKYFD